MFSERRKNGRTCKIMRMAHIFGGLDRRRKEVCFGANYHPVVMAEFKRAVCFEADYHTVMMADSLGGMVPVFTTTFLGYVCVSFSVLYLYDDTLYRFCGQAAERGIRTC
jgi:hypothetical protein